MNRELKLEIVVPYCTDNAGDEYQSELLDAFEEFIAQKLNRAMGCSFCITDEVADGSPAKLICPHCKGNVFGAPFAQEDNQ